MDDTQTPSNATRLGTSVDRRGFIIGLGLTATAAVSYLATPSSSSAQVPAESFRKLIPESVGGWKSKSSSQLVLPAKDDLEKKLYENLETRIYEGPSLPSIMFLIAYSSRQQNDVQVHRPEVCYPVAGFPILESQSTEVQFGATSINAVELVADRQGSNERIVYWVRVGDRYPGGFWSQRLAMAQMSFAGGIPDGLLFRVSVFEEDPNYKDNSLRDFIRAFEKSSSADLKRDILLG